MAVQVDVEVKHSPCRSSDPEKGICPSFTMTLISLETQEIDHGNVTFATVDPEKCMVKLVEKSADYTIAARIVGTAKRLAA